MKIDPRRFILDNTDVMAPPHVPEIRLHLASEVHDLWLKTEEDLAEIGLPPPFWAFAWAGGQGLARYILDHPQAVAGKTVVDFASGSGLVAIAAAKAGALSVVAADIDPFVPAAIALNAAENEVELAICAEDLVGKPLQADVLLAGDVFYDQSFAERLLPWFSLLSGSGLTVLVGDPGRSYCPRDRMQALASYEVPVTRVLEDSEIKRTTVWRFA
ncbi:class I SAM-dependent methyltransferase [Allorhizobium taibaishanense]|uniref:Nicotinamide N-methyase n=1 Tax=Allorhizobium taibaishanense TaxID=887144 RepID=A0A1Q9A1Q1_9HYPH|nr:methyltransferase [Allorhizobium taibaishanense]MBB4009195.1 putative nicotinamide N-methyase [Allorhizobium taibaishanense]OLP48530.1 nicotinamide N-methyase [Allorhizobium taibaishanense]